MRFRRVATFVFLLVAVYASQLRSEEEQPVDAVATENRRGKHMLDESIRSSITFQATFNTTIDADISKGDKEIRTADSLERQKSQRGLHTEAVEWDKSNGRSGGSLKFKEATKQLVYFRGGKNLPYKAKDFDGTVSFWMRLSPKEDLPKGYVDPLQITDKKWNDSSFFVDFDQTKERPFRLGVFADLKFWNPKDRKFDDIPDNERPMVTVKKWPFNRDKWTHVAFTWADFNSERRATATLYLDGKSQGDVVRPQQFTWNSDKTVIMLGINYIGWLDDLTVFDRRLTAKQIGQMSK